MIDFGTVFEAKRLEFGALALQVNYTDTSEASGLQQGAVFRLA